jgi:NitT/TauT family transport system substrate-binding protein
LMTRGVPKTLASACLRAAVVTVLTLLMHGAGAQDRPAETKVRLVVGGKSAIFYLPLAVTERLGYFKERGIDAEIADVQSGARALQSLIGGSADVGVGTFDHTIQMQAKGQPVVAVLQYGLYPGFVLGTLASKAIAYAGPQSLKGLKIGVTSPGSSTHFMAAYMLVRSGFKADDASFIGIGVTSTAVAAARRGEIDALVSSDPMISLMQSEGLVRIVADTRTLAGTQAVYGGPYPGGVVYTTPAFIERNPAAVQAIVTAFVHALRWMPAHSADRKRHAAGVRAREQRGLHTGARREPGNVFARRTFRRGRRRDCLSGAQTVRCVSCECDDRPVQNFGHAVHRQGAVSRRNRSSGWISSINERRSDSDSLARACERNAARRGSLRLRRARHGDRHSDPLHRRQQLP